MADFIAGYISGAASIILGSPLDIIKARLQSPPINKPTTSLPPAPSSPVSTAPPIATCGVLNALLFTTYNRCLPLLPSPHSLPNIFTAGALAGLTTFLISTPTEVVKLRAQLSQPPVSSWVITRGLIAIHGIKGLYIGGGVTALRDAVGYGFYFAAYEGVKRGFGEPEGAKAVLIAGGVAGCVTWASVYPLDVVKTRVQTQVFGGRGRAWECARVAWREGGWRVFCDGLGVCMARAFLVCTL
ncbi:mitochondrial carrier domain-containing protein [Trichophaea hybrida]|nr:mitochondrial carrier domain-containing protein [Trichophaea hybrida]